MANPIAFPSTTNRLSLPLLFAGQAQKEPFINHALSAIDALLTGVIDDSLASPPGSPPEGARYRVLENASGEWQGKAGGYGIQGYAGAFVVSLNGSYTGVVGLPLFETRALLKAAGLKL